MYSGPCHAKPNNHRRCCKSMAFLQMRCILPAAKQTKTEWNLPSAAWPTQHKMFSIQSPKPHLADSLLAKHIVSLPLHAHSYYLCRNLWHVHNTWDRHAHLHPLYATRSTPSRCRLVGSESKAPRWPWVQYVRPVKPTISLIGTIKFQNSI